jgi:hypothetical protein
MGRPRSQLQDAGPDVYDHVLFFCLFCRPSERVWLEPFVDRGGVPSLLDPPWGRRSLRWKHGRWAGCPVDFLVRLTPFGSRAGLMRLDPIAVATLPLFQRHPRCGCGVYRVGSQYHDHSEIVNGKKRISHGDHLLWSGDWNFRMRSLSPAPDRQGRMANDLPPDGIHYPHEHHGFCPRDLPDGLSGSSKKNQTCSEEKALCGLETTRENSRFQAGLKGSEKTRGDSKRLSLIHQGRLEANSLT